MRVNVDIRMPWVSPISLQFTKLIAQFEFEYPHRGGILAQMESLQDLTGEPCQCEADDLEDEIMMILKMR